MKLTVWVQRSRRCKRDYFNFKRSKQSVILTANDVYAEKSLAPLRTAAELLEFRKINYLSIAKRLRTICSLEGIEFDEEAVKELARNCGGILEVLFWT